MLHTENMQEVAEFGAVPDAGAYRFRISEVRETDQQGAPLMSAKGEPKVVFVCKVQDEGKFLGQQIQMHVSLQAHALATLKSLYKACGYNPGTEGHDPSTLVDGEFYAYGEPQEVEGANGKITTFNIAPWNIKSLQEGPPRVRGKAV